jgi:hypothetical protein
VCALGLLAWIAGGSARAEDYEVEVIVFRHAAPQAAGAWASEATLPDFGAARRLAEPADDVVAATDGAMGTASGPAPFTALPPTAFRLTGAGKLLAGSAAYEVVAHVAWQQPGDGVSAVYVGDPVATAGVGSAPGALDGGAAFAVAPSRPRAEGTLRLQVALPEMRVQSDFVVLAGDSSVHVKATRNLKSGELHYLDHELLGVLLQVTSLAPASPIEGEIVAPNADLPEEEFSD